MKTQQSSSSIDSRLFTVNVNDVDQTGRSMVAMLSQRSGLFLASHVPHDGTRVLASLKPTVGTVITISPDCKSATWMILSTAASSQDSRRSRVTMLAWSCLASFELFTRLLDLRSVMRFFSFPPAVGYTLFSPAVGHALFLWLTSTIHLLSTDLRPAPATGRSH